MANTTTFSFTKEGDVLNQHHLIAKVLREALPYIDFLKEKTLVIKLGGSTLEHQRSIIQDIIWLQALGAHPVLVHGGGPYINEWMNKLNVPTRFENGLRVTDAQTLDIVRMVLLGQVNSGLVLMASQMDGKAIGLSGTDGNMIRARIIDERRVSWERSISRSTLLKNLIEQGYIPVIAPLGASQSGTCLNINADLVAAHLAGALNAEKLIFLSNVVGILRTDGSLISELTEVEALHLIEEGSISGGMIPKVSRMLNGAVSRCRIHICDGEKPSCIAE